MQHPFKVLEPEYQRRLAVLRITRPQIAARARTILNRPSVISNFKPVQDALGIPMVWMICSFERESSLDFTRSPAQGDRWDCVSVNVPRGVGPFSSFTDAALWSYRHDGIDKNSSPWTWAYACWGWEKFNGLGPRDHGHVSGYVFAGTDQYDPPAGLGGKYVSDGKWNGSTVDSQFGCVPLALELIKLEPSLALLSDAAPVPAPIVVTPVPVGVGGSNSISSNRADHRSAKWIQIALNVIGLSGTPLMVDGSYGRNTRNAVRAFQAHEGLAADGLAGPLTVKALEQASGTH